MTGVRGRWEDRPYQTYGGHHIISLRELQDAIRYYRFLGMASGWSEALVPLGVHVDIPGDQTGTISQCGVRFFHVWGNFHGSRRQRKFFRRIHAERYYCNFRRSAASRFFGGSDFETVTPKYGILPAVKIMCR